MVRKEFINKHATIIRRYWDNPITNEMLSDLVTELQTNVDATGVAASVIDKSRVEDYARGNVNIVYSVNGREYTTKEFAETFLVNIKTMEPKEFLEGGFLQEANRLFFHPLGLALAVKVDSEAGTYTLDCIWDSRDDEEGFIFDIPNAKPEDIADMQRKFDNVKAEWERHKAARENMFGRNVFVEMIPDRVSGL